MGEIASLIDYTEAGMDTELKIKQLEEELRHEQEMRRLQGGRMDAYDRSFAAIHATLDVVTSRLAVITEIQHEFTISQGKTDSMLRDLIQAITRDHSNGKS